MKKILVIEDDPHVRENIQEILELENFEPITTDNGREGLRLAQTRIPDLIICDVMLSELDGHEILIALRRNPVTVMIPFIFLAKASRLDIRQGMELGADDYITKPFTPTELLKAIAARLTKQALMTQSYTEQIQALTEGLEYVTHYNSLTQLPNQRLLRKRFNHIQSDCSGQLIPILLLSLDQFSWIRRTFGAQFSDTILTTVADRLTTHFSPLNHHSEELAHLEGDQFLVLLKAVQHADEAAQVAKTLLDIFAEPFSIDEHTISLTASIGIALYPADNSRIDNLIAQAEVAMYRTKQKGGNHYQFYTAQMQFNATEQLTLEKRLRQGIEQNEFQLYYQPQVDLITGKVIGAEALVRWHNPILGWVSPRKFIPIAEETGLIVPLGEWVLRAACQQAKSWQDIGDVNLQIAVNLSARQLTHPNLTDKIIQILTDTNLKPQFLDLELTESLLIQDKDTAIHILRELKRLGIYISLDDFGTGYSSLQYLQQFTFDTLKIDQCFVRNIDSNPGNIAIVRAIIQMAHSLNLKLIAEGVETETELFCLRQQSCDAMQGYLFSPPLSAVEFESLLTSGKQLQWEQLTFF